MKRNFKFQILMMILFSEVVVMLGCQSMRDLTASLDQDRALKKLKRGTLNDDGLYRNEIYEFTLNLPKNWKGDVGDPPIVLTGKPPEKEILDSYARKFIDIKVYVRNISEKETIESVIENYRKRNQYELVLQRPVSIKNAEARKCIFYGKIKDQSVKVLSLIAIHSDKEIILQCQALKPLFDNVEAQFDYSVRSFRITAKPEKEGVETPTPSPFDRSTDYFVYKFKTGDTIEKIAEMYLGDPKRGDLILELNKLKKVEVGEEIKIPRYLEYKIKKGDTFKSIAKKVLKNESYSDWLKTYNRNHFGSEGEIVYVPLYIIELLEEKDTYAGIAQKYYQNKDLGGLIADYNNKKQLGKGVSIKIPVFPMSKFYLYTVEVGDSLALIAKWLTGDSMKYLEIARYNNIPHPYTLTPGQILKIPAGLIKDPNVFNTPKPKPKSKPAPSKNNGKMKKDKKETKEDLKKKKAEKKEPTPTPEPPLEEQDIYEID